MIKIKQLSTAFLSRLAISLLFISALSSCLKPDDPADGKEDPNKPGEFDPTLRVPAFPEATSFPAGSVLLEATSFPAGSVPLEATSFPADSVQLADSVLTMSPGSFAQDTGLR